jgi:nickel/cobalt transporter (NiCoT) family protein
MRQDTYRPERLEELLSQRGLASPLLAGRLQNLINHSWQLYPVGFLFGLGFDTASEIGLLALAAGAATERIPVLAITSLALLFASGMSFMDTVDGVFMVGAYRWAFSNPLRKVYYNITITSLSVAVALMIGTVELLQVLVASLGNRRFFHALWAINFQTLGYLIVAFFLVGWGASVVPWKVRRIEERWSVAR